MRRTFVFAGCIVAAGLTAAAAGTDALHWKELPPLPDREGFAGMYAGVSGGALLAAGGANFPDKPPDQGGLKVWYDAIFVLRAPDATWEIAAEKLPHPSAYGVSATYGDALICAGGSDATRHYADVFMLRLTPTGTETTVLPALPRACASVCGAVVGDMLYVAGGLERPKATEALHTFCAMDLSQPVAQMQWRELPAWPGCERFEATAAAQAGAFFLLSGFQADANAKDQRVFLTDAYRYAPGGGQWTRIADLPKPIAAGPSPALALGATQFATLGGLDNIKIGPPFPREILVYDVEKDAWTDGGLMPEGSTRVTLPTTPWRGGWAVIGGEIAPGKRSPKVYWVGP